MADVPSEVDPCSHMTEASGCKLQIWFDVGIAKKGRAGPRIGEEQRIRIGRIGDSVPVLSPAGAASDAEGFVGESGDLVRRGLELRYFGYWVAVAVSEYAPTVVHVLFSMPRGDSKFLGGCRPGGGLDGWTPRTPPRPHPLHPQIATVFEHNLHAARTPRHAARPSIRQIRSRGADTFARKASDG